MNSLRRNRSFTFVAGNTANNPNISVSLKTTDMKNSISFTLDILAPSSYRTISNLNINFESYPLVAIRAREDYNGYNGYIVEDYNVSNGSYSGSSQKELKFPFENLKVHKFEYTVEVADTQGNYGKYIYIYNFIYFTVPVTLSDFAFDTNTLQTGDKIQITGLSLNHHSNLNSNGNIVDTTFPESVDNSGEIIPNAQGLYILDGESIVDVDGVVSNRSYAPFVRPALKFTFQKVGVVSPDLPSSEVNNDIDALYDPQVLHFNPDGNYTLPANTLHTNAVYAVKVQALWADGFYGTKVTTQNINIIGRPVIEYVTTLPLYVKNNDDPAVTIGVSGDVGNKVWFNFYNESNALVAKAGGVTGIDIISGEEINEYSLSLNQIIKTIGGNGLLNGVQYSVKVETKYGAIVMLSDAEYVTFALVNPSIDTVTTYDIQQDGGNDGVGDDASNQDASNQIVATIMVNTTEYELYAPNEVDGIKFYIYDEDDVKVASTSSYTFLNDDNEDTNLYNIRLNEITLEGNSLTLTNGTEYSIKAEVTLLNHKGVTSETRLSDAYTNVVFNQDVAPISNLTVSNTWELATDYNPSSEIGHFNNSPLIGISGHFKKTAQFDASNYPKQLDTASTKFKLEYKLNGGNSWSLVTKAVLDQKLETENIKVAVNRVKGLTLVSSVDGLYDNVVGTILGTSQEPLVFYIPQNQGNGNAFDETNSVIIRVTVVDEASLWAGVNEATTDSSSVQLINKINSYSYTNGESSEPWNSENKAYYDSVGGLLNVDVNGSIVQANKSNVIGDSNPIIAELDQGWRVLNTGVNSSGATGGKLPKVNLYYYGNSVSASQQTASNSVKVNQISNMGMYVIIDQHQGALEYPYIMLYTTPTASDNKASWYKSSLLYAATLSGNTVLDSSRSGLTLLYSGNDDLSFHPEIPSSRRVKINVSPDYSDTFGNYENELVNLVSIQTSSNAATSQTGSFNFTISEAGLKTSSSVLSSLVMRFAHKLVLNIPVNWNTTHAHSLKLGYKYSLDASYSYLTYNYGDVQVDTMGNKYVSLTVDPSLGTILYYSVAYIVNNTNLPSAPLTTQGLTIDVNVPNKNFPVSSSYAVADDTFKTFNNDGDSSITFTLTEQLSNEDRLDGINVYFSSTSEQNNGTAIPLTRIQSYLLSNINGTSNTITLMNSSGGTLNIMGNTGNIVSVPALYWKDYSEATISFKGFRDRRVNTAVTSISFPYNSLEYTESGSKEFADSIWNTPIIDSPSGGGGDGGGEVANPITLHGGVINSANPSTDTFVEWPASNDNNGNPFKYDFTLIKINDGTVPLVIQYDANVTGNSKVLSIETEATAKYRVEIRTVFQVGSRRELSSPIVIEFYSIKVDVSGMNVAITRPSNNQLVNLSWNEPAFTGSSITTDGSSASSSFATNINTFRMVYTTTNTATPVTLNHLKSGNNLIERITSPATSYQYDLPNQNLATLYSFFMQVKAQVAYTVDSSLSSSKSVPVLISYLSSTVTSQYRVSTIPVINPLPSNTPVLTNVSSNPTLLLDLDARGLENEGFISVVCILTQDGTDTKPGGSSAMVVFPAPPSSPNYLPDASGNVLGNNGSILENAGSSSDVRLVSGQGYESTPVNVNNSTISITNSAYKLTIGSPSTNYGRYGYSTLEMPLSVNSGFQNSGNPSDAAYNPVNYMIIVTTRRGTDYNVGTFTYAAPPAVSNVNVVNTNGTYYVNFNISPA